MGQRADAEGEGVSNPTRPELRNIFDVYGRPPNSFEMLYDVDDADAYMDHCEATIKRLYDLLRADRRYRTLLQTEIARMSGFMYVHGQTTPQETVDAGKVCRDEIATLEAALTEGA